MARPMFDSEYIFGIHEEGGERNMLEAGKPGWVLFTEGIGHDPNNQSGRNYRPYSDQGLGIMVRLNNGYHPEGTIPTSAHYGEFAQRCANFVANSQGCKIWIIGNEMNYDIERPRYSAQGGPSFQQSPIVDEEDESGDSVEEVVIPPPFPPAEELPWWRRIWSTLTGRGGSDSGNDGDEVAPAPPAPPVSPPIPSPPGAPSELPVAPEESDPLHRSDPRRFSALTAETLAEMEDEAVDLLPDGEFPAPPPPLYSANTDVEVITPDLYARCYTLCRDAVHALPGHADDQVLIGGVAPWNNQTQYDGNPNGDWVRYMRDILDRLGADGCDGITLHTYTHAADANLIYDDSTMNPPFQTRHYQFRAYRDFMVGIPEPMRHLPVYITETDEDVEWLDSNIAWVQRAYGEIDYWNQQPGNQQIRSLILYRWPKRDKWYIDGKDGLIDDFKHALQNDYRWRETPPEPADYQVDDLLEMLDLVNMRRTPGYIEQAEDDLIAVLPMNTRVRVLDSVWQEADGLIWWRVRVSDQTEQIVDVEQPGEEGWIAQYSPTGAPLVALAEETQPPVDNELTVGSLAETLDFVNLRRSSGYVDKPADDVISSMPPGTEIAIADGPQHRDGLTWWEVRGVDGETSLFTGWSADTAPNGAPLLVKTGEMELPPDLGGGDGSGGQFEHGDAVVTLDYVRFRNSPGYTDKPDDDVIADLPPDTSGEVLSGPRTKDELIWWRLGMSTPVGGRKGWAAETAPNGVALLAPAATGPVAPEPGSDSFRHGDLIVTAVDVRVRRSPGNVGKPDDDTLGAFRPQTTLNVIDGPVAADGLAWWRVGGISIPAGELIGWVAEKAPNGVTLLTYAPKLPGTNIPDPAGVSLAMPFRGVYGISQLWGERPEVYGQFTYDGVPLQGHNGIDFLTPTGTLLQAVDDGVVASAMPNDQTGLGTYVLLHHAWGESIYAHLERFDVQPGQNVQRGQLLGRTDNTGYSGGPHLHFAIRINPYARTDGWGGYSDPLPYLPRGQVLLPAYVLPPDQRPPLPMGAPAPADAPLSDASASGMAPDQPGVQRP